MMRHRRVGYGCVASVALLVVGLTHPCAAQVGYSGGNYSQNFDTLPTDKPNGANIGASPAGWQDNLGTAYTPGDTNFGLAGWYLYHPADLGAGGEGGFNQHQRVRFNNGNSTTGAFYGFANATGFPTASANPEKALGMVNSASLAGDGVNAYMGLRLTNNTGSAITSFTLSFDGEQWRDGPSASPESLLFGYSTTATTTDWATTGTFTSVPQLNFTSPVFGSTTGTNIDGNTAGKQSLTANVFGLSWAPGADLWLRWSDSQLAGLTDDGLAIDNLVFTAPSTGPAPDINSAASGNSSAGSTWVGGAPPVAGNNYHVLSGHTVTIDAAMPAATLIEAQAGATINIGPTGNGVAIPNMTISSGGALTVTATGDVSIGDPAAHGNLVLNNDATFNIDPGPASPTCDLCLNMKITGSGNININSASGTSVSIPQAAGMAGTVNFNGTGDLVKVDGTESIPKLVMNSTGQNKVAYIGADVGNVTFNQPGSIDHLTTTASRLQGGTLIANAAVTVNETTGYPDNSSQTEERRWQTTSLQGSGNVTANGTLANYTNAAGTITLNEFEVGTTGEPTGSVPNSSYSGTLTFNDYINGELRQNLRRAAVVVNNHARVEFGFQVQHPDPAKFLNAGEITVNNGGTLEVGFEQGPVASSPFYATSASAGTGHHVARLNLTSIGGRSGNLTLNSGSTLRMQINGTNPDQFDSIVATGHIQLGGTLDLLANPPTTDGSVAEAYFPGDGDTFTIMSIAAAPVQGDYDGNGTVGQEDYDLWRSTFGTTGNFVASDGDNNGGVDAGDYAVWRKHVGQTASVTGSISGDFTLNVLDPYTSWTGYTIEKIITPTSVQLKFHAGAGAGASVTASVPEPSTIALTTMLLGALGIIHRRRTS